MPYVCAASLITDSHDLRVHLVWYDGDTPCHVEVSIYLIYGGLAFGRSLGPGPALVSRHSVMSPYEVLSPLGDVTECCDI